MHVPYEASGRRAQKQRTRAQLLDAAARLFAGQVTPTVAQVADAAGISRTTAYRYFATQADLVAAAFPQTERESLLPDPAPQDVYARLDLAITEFSRFNIDHEPQLRAQLRISLQPGAAATPLRHGRAVRWIEDALAPLRESHPRIDVHPLAVAIRAATGIESLIWLTDVGDMDREQVTETAQWTARALLDAAVRDAATPRRRMAARSRR